MNVLGVDVDAVAAVAVVASVSAAVLTLQMLPIFVAGTAYSNVVVFD